MWCLRLNFKIANAAGQILRFVIVFTVLIYGLGLIGKQVLSYLESNRATKEMPVKTISWYDATSLHLEDLGCFKAPLYIVSISNTDTEEQACNQLRIFLGRRNLPDSDCLRQIEGMDITSFVDDKQKSGCAVVNNSFLSRVPNLTVLVIKYAVMNKDSYDSIGVAKNIMKLKLDNCNFSDACAPMLLKLKDLRALSLTGTKITDKSMKVIGQLTWLEELDLSNTDVGNTGMSYISSLRNLRYINLSHTNVNGAALKYMTRLPLMYLNVNIGDDPSSLKVLSEFKGLRYLYLTTQHLNNEDLRAFEKIPDLKELRVSPPGAIDLKGKEYLEGLRKFAVLKL